jgi:hypothetical protein
MQPIENEVWQRFRLANLAQLRALYFNVHCGTVPGLQDDTTDAENRLRSTLWSKRVDVVAETIDEVWLIEVKAAARPSAVGQTLTYIPILGQRRASWRGARPLIVAAQFDPDALNLCGLLGVECIGPPFVPLGPRPAAPG